MCYDRSQCSTFGDLQATCSPEPLPNSPGSKPKCSNCRKKKLRCNWGDSIPRQMNTIKISIYEGLPEEGGLVDEDDSDANDDDDDNSDYSGADYDDSETDHTDNVVGYNHDDSGDIEESARMSLGVPGMTSRESLLQATNSALAHMCLEQEECVDRLVDRLEELFSSNPFAQ